MPLIATPELEVTNLGGRSRRRIVSLAVFRTHPGPSSTLVNLRELAEIGTSATVIVRTGAPGLVGVLAALLDKAAIATNPAVPIGGQRRLNKAHVAMNLAHCATGGIGIRD